MNNSSLGQRKKESLIAEMKQTQKRYLLKKENHNRVVLELKDNRMVSFCVDSQNKYQVGDIFLGKVQKVAKNIGGIFVKIDKDTTCFLPLEDGKHPLVTNRKFDGSLKESDELVVRITKEAYKNKLMSVSTTIETVFSYFVISLKENKGEIRFSKKIPQERKEELIAFLENMVPDGYSVLVRTEAKEAKAEELLLELNLALEETSAVLKKASHCMPYVKLFEKERKIEELIKKSRREEDSCWVTDCRECYQFLLEETVLKDYPKKVHFYDNEELPLAVLYGLKTKLDEITKEKVWMSNGGCLYITPTEALVVIDVNSGKCSQGKEKEASVLEINKAAAKEIAFQIGARNLSGIILVDFINLKEEKHRTILLQCLKEHLEELSPKGIVVDITKLGLIEITRKKITPDIYQFKDILNKTILT